MEKLNGKLVDMNNTAQPKTRMHDSSLHMKRNFL